MAESIIISGNNKKEKYESLIPQLIALTEGETDVIANIANVVEKLDETKNKIESINVKENLPPVPSVP